MTEVPRIPRNTICKKKHTAPSYLPNYVRCYEDLSLNQIRDDRYIMWLEPVKIISEPPPETGTYNGVGWPFIKSTKGILKNYVILTNEDTMTLPEGVYQ